MALISKTSKAKRYFGLVAISVMISGIALLFFNAVANIPQEYVFGNFDPLPPYGVHMIAELNPAMPTIPGEKVYVTVFASDDRRPLADRIIIVKDSQGNDAGGGRTDSTGQGTFTYPGLGAIVRITSDGSYIRDAIMFLPVQEKWVIATRLLYLGGIMSGLAVGIGLYFLSKRLRWL